MRIPATAPLLPIKFPYAYTATVPTLPPVAARYGHSNVRSRLETVSFLFTARFLLQGRATAILLPANTAFPTHAPDRKLDRRYRTLQDVTEVHSSWLDLVM